MAFGYFLRVGDKTTCGGQILTGDNTMQWYGVAGAREGDMVSCGKHSGAYQILGGVSSMWLENRKHAGSLDSFSSCPCHSRFIPFISDCYEKEDEQPQTRSFTAPQEEKAYQQPRGQHNTTHYTNPIVAADDNRIRIDAQNLIDCANEICEKHLHFPDIKNAFKNEVESFAYEIVEQVESGQMSYEEGSSELKKEEKSLWEQSIDWVLNGLSIIGGLGLTAAGIALCSTGAGCLIGAPIMAHGLNGIYEGTVGFYEGNSDIQGPLREGYKASAKALGFNESVGNLTYDLVDMGLSIRGKLQLVPKLTRRYGENRKIKPFVLYHYAREDLDYAFRQTNKFLLNIELLGDLINITKVKKDLENAFVLDKETGTLMLSVVEPEKITNIEYITEHCTRMIVIVGPNDSSPSYYSCKDKKGNDYNVTQDGKLM